MKTSAVEKPTVAIIHPSLWRGGSEPCALWAIEALKRQYEVTLIASSEVDLDQLNRYYGTNLMPHELKIIRVPIPIPLRWIKGFFMLRYFRLQRYCRKNSSRFQVMFSSYNPMDFGKRGIQYVLDPNFDQHLLLKMAGQPKGIRRLFYKDSLGRRLYQSLSRRLSGSTHEGLRQNQTLVDSDWTGHFTRLHLNVETKTVYPPVVTSFKPRAWTAKDEGFVCIGRIISEKKIENIIQVIDQLNKGGSKLHLHIIGTVGNARYFESLIKLSSGKDWIFFEIGIPFSRKNLLLETHRYGIHGRENEPFGIGIAEMIKAGCIVWVPQGGGQVEIVNQDELTYTNIDDAVSKISSVLASPASQKRLREHLRHRSELFSTGVYMEEIVKIVKFFLLSSATGA